MNRNNYTENLKKFYTKEGMKSLRREISKLLRSPIARGRVSKCIWLLTIWNITLFVMKLPGPMCWTPDDRWNISFARVKHLKFPIATKEEDPTYNVTEVKNMRLQNIDPFKLLNKIQDTRFCYEGGHTSSDLIIIIKSRLENFKTRNVIRMTWGHYHLHARISIMFVSAAFHGIVPETVGNKLKEEMDLYGDLAVNHGPIAKNPNVERLFIFTWLQTNCPEAQMILIVRENVFVNLPALIDTWTIKEIMVNDSVYGRIETREEEKHSQSIIAHNKKWKPTAIFFSNSFVPALLDKAWEQKLTNTKNIVHEILMADPKVRKIRIQQTLKVPYYKKELFYCFMDEAICVELQDDKWPVEFFPLWHHTAVNSSVCANDGTNNVTASLPAIPKKYTSRVETQFVF